VHGASQVFRVIRTG